MAQTPALFSFAPAEGVFKRLKQIEQRVVTKESQRYLYNASRNVARRVQRDFKRTTKTWNHKVNFEYNTTTQLGADEVGFIITVDDPIWRLLNSGTSWRSVALHPGYKPKTVPYEYDSYPGGTNEVFKRAGRYPGIEARAWTSQVYIAGVGNELRKEIRKQLQNWISTL